MFGFFLYNSSIDNFRSIKLIVKNHPTIRKWRSDGFLCARIMMIGDGKMDKLQIAYRKVSELIPYANNPRKNDNAVDAVAESIKQFGFKIPIIIDGN